MEPDYNSQLIIDLKNEVAALKTYISDRDAAAKLAAETKAAADAVAAQTAADAAAAQKIIDDAALTTEKQAEIDFRSALLQKSTETNNLLIAFNEKEFPTAVDNSALLSEIVQNTSTTQFENEVGSLAYYANMGIIILVFGVLPVYLGYRFIRPIVGMVNKIF